MDGRSDAWTTAAAYEAFMGRWSRSLAPRFVSWLGVRAGAHWLDVGCGTGALSEAICEAADPASVTACDPSDAFIALARGRAKGSRIAFETCGVGALPARSGGYDCVTSAFALNFFPDHASAVDEFARLASAGGVVSACVWDYAGRMELLRRFWDAVAAVDPGAADLDEGRRFPVCRPDALESLFASSGLVEIVCEPIEITTRFDGFDGFWAPLLGGTGPAPAYVASLDEERRARLAEYLSSSLPRDDDGGISLIARAWAVRGARS
jgi:SAM-dependent methyltransferase